MSLASGAKVGHYEVGAPLGAGGIGEVYRARDAKLGRDVALKVLPDAFARDTQRMTRFQREAKVLASLNHPNIAAIYGVEDSSGTLAIIMELVEGPTLADRIRQGPIAIEEALRIARQICEALEYAHERGIVHRDLKPANERRRRQSPRLRPGKSHGSRPGFARHFHFPHTEPYGHPGRSFAGHHSSDVVPEDVNICQTKTHDKLMNVFGEVHCVVAAVRGRGFAYTTEVHSNHRESLC